MCTPTVLISRFLVWRCGLLSVMTRKVFWNAYRQRYVKILRNRPFSPQIIRENLWLALKPQISQITRIFLRKPKGRFFRFVFQYLIEIQTHTAHQIYKKNALKRNECALSYRQTTLTYFKCVDTLLTYCNKSIPKVTMFAVEMWFGVGDGVECGRSTGLCPLPLGVPRCVIHNKKMLERNFW